MKAKSKLIILTVVLSVCIVATAVGVTVAYWVGAEGSNQIAPQTDTTDWNYYAKYFIYEEVKNGSNAVIGYRVVGFKDTVLENVIIPRYATGGWLRTKDKDGNTVLTAISTNNPVAVISVGNSVFAGDTDKRIPVTLTIPTTVDVEAGAFVGLTNLTKITIKAVKGTGINSTLDDTINIGVNAFFGCDNVTKFVADDYIRLVTVGASSTSLDDFNDAFKAAIGIFDSELSRSEN